MTTSEVPSVHDLAPLREIIAGEVAFGSLLVDGLCASLRGLGWDPDGDGPMRAPGLAEVCRELTFLATATAEAFEEVMAAIEAAQVAGGGALAAKVDEAAAGFGRAGDVTREARLGMIAGILTRRAGQAALGAVAASGGIDEVVRIERAAATLLSVGGRGGLPSLGGDGLHLYSRDVVDLEAELTGVAARLLCELGGTVELRLADGMEIELSCDEDGMLALRAPHEPSLDRQWPWPSCPTGLGTAATRILVGHGVTRGRDVAVLARS